VKDWKKLDNSKNKEIDKQKYKERNTKRNKRTVKGKRTKTSEVSKVVYAVARFRLTVLITVLGR
jgi:hypothetical protein